MMLPSNDLRGLAMAISADRTLRIGCHGASVLSPSDEVELPVAVWLSLPACSRLEVEELAKMHFIAQARAVRLDGTLHGLDERDAIHGIELVGAGGGLVRATGSEGVVRWSPMLGSCELEPLVVLPGDEEVPIELASKVASHARALWVGFECPERPQAVVRLVFEKRSGGHDLLTLRGVERLCYTARAEDVEPAVEGRRVELPLSDGGRCVLMGTELRAMAGPAAAPMEAG